MEGEMPRPGSSRRPRAGAPDGCSRPAVVEAEGRYEIEPLVGNCEEAAGGVEHHVRLTHAAR